MKKIILASASPRRHYLLKELNIPFEVEVRAVDEVYPDGLKREEIALYLAKLKAAAFENQIAQNTLIITADTIVWIDNKVLGKPLDTADAKRMLNILSGRMHEVITAVCLKSSDKEKLFFVESKVWFKKLTDAEIDWYIERFKPFDKAGAYGVQEWLGYVGIERIEGSYFNIMGLPLKEVYEGVMSYEL